MDVNIIAIVNSIKEILKNQIEEVFENEKIINHEIAYFDDNSDSHNIQLIFTDMDDRTMYIEIATNLDDVIKDIKIPANSEMDIPLKLIQYLSNLKLDRLVKTLIIDLKLEVDEESTWINFRNNLNKVKGINVLKCNQITE